MALLILFKNNYQVDSTKIHVCFPLNKKLILTKKLILLMYLVGPSIHFSIPKCCLWGGEVHFHREIYDTPIHRMNSKLFLMQTNESVIPLVLK